MVIHSTLSDFILFLYVHVADSDQDYDPAELGIIKEKMSTLFPDGTDLEKKLYTTIRQYNLFDKSQLNALFTDSFKHFKRDMSGLDNNVFSDIKDIILADGLIKTSETNALEALKQFIDQSIKARL